MSELKHAPEILSFESGPIQVNCYLVYPVEGGTLYVIDPGGDASRMAELASLFPAGKREILFTHGHADHIHEAGKAAKLLGVKTVYVHPRDHEMYHSPENSLEPVLLAAVDLPDDAWPPPESKDFSILETPGHTEGCVCYYFPSMKALFTGDTLFAGSVGRTDLPGAGTYEDLIRGVREKIFVLPGGTRVFPGHGPETTVADEKLSNPYFN